jgi:hypothetical protein
MEQNNQKIEAVNFKIYFNREYGILRDLPTLKNQPIRQEPITCCYQVSTGNLIAVVSNEICENSVTIMIANKKLADLMAERAKGSEWVIFSSSETSIGLGILKKVKLNRLSSITQNRPNSEYIVSWAPDNSSNLEYSKAFDFMFM